jgi:hypothetical protein
MCHYHTHELRFNIHTHTYPTNHGANDVKLLNVETEQIIRSGDEIWLETDNPLLMPLPDWRISDMQWVLQRLAAISGAAEANETKNQTTLLLF